MLKIDLQKTFVQEDLKNCFSHFSLPGLKVTGGGRGWCASIPPVNGVPVKYACYS